MKQHARYVGDPHNKEWHAANEYRIALREVRKVLTISATKEAVEGLRERVIEAAWLRELLGWAPTDFYIDSIRVEGVRVQRVTSHPGERVIGLTVQA